MVAGAHPSAVDRGRRLGDGHVFFDQAEVRACLRGALADIRLTAIAVGNWSLGNHAEAVLASGGGQSGIPTERGSPGRGARLIGKQDDLPRLRLNCK